MSEWRREALKRFPEQESLVKTARSIQDLYFTLFLDLQAGYRAPEPPSDYIERIWAFAAWCFDSKRNRSVRNAVAVGFYEHLPAFGPARRELPRRITIQAFAELIPAFRVTLSEAELATFGMEFLTSQGTKRLEARRWLAKAGVAPP